MSIFSGKLGKILEAILGQVISGDEESVCNTTKVGMFQRSIISEIVRMKKELDKHQYYSHEGWNAIQREKSGSETVQAKDCPT